jgi:hypothetical protein
MPSAEEIAEEYRKGASRAPEAYKKGVQSATGWKESALKGEDNYGAAVRKAADERSRAKGVEASSDEEWRKGAVDTGSTRIGPGMLAKQDKRKRNYEPIRAALNGLEVPDRTLDPMANIDNRLKKVVQAQIDASNR